MVRDIRSKIARMAASKQADQLREIGAGSQEAFDLLIPWGVMEQLVRDVVRPAFDEYIALTRGAWACSVVEAREVRLPPDVAVAVGNDFACGIAIRFSQILGIVGVRDHDDPSCVLLYNEWSQKAFWVTQHWGSPHIVRPVKSAELTQDRLLERIYAFSGGVRQWELKHPPIATGFDPYPRYARAI